MYGMKHMQFKWMRIRQHQGIWTSIAFGFVNLLSTCLSLLALYHMKNPTSNIFQNLNYKIFQSTNQMKGVSQFNCQEIIIVFPFSLQHTVFQAINPLASGASLNKLRSSRCALAKALGQPTLESMNSVCDVTDVTFLRSTAPD